MKNQPSLDPGRLVFVDEAGVCLALSHNYGWAPVGVVPVIQRPARGKRISLIGAIAMDGTRALRRVEGSVTGDEFVAFLREDLGPNLTPNDIVILDGPSIHRVAGVKEALDEVGATVLYLPGCSPELNPIEMTWSWLKQRLRDIAARRIGLLRSSVDELWAKVTAELCQAWIQHSGYVAVST